MKFYIPSLSLLRVTHVKVTDGVFWNGHTVIRIFGIRVATIQRTFPWGD
jgi:hypothetical protein